MPMPRDIGNRAREAGGEDWKQMSSPYGYDRPEFSPEQAPRDFKRPRRHEPDDERRRLRSADAAMEGPAAGEAQPNKSKSEKWDNEDIQREDIRKDPVSRLYRD